MTPAQNSLKNFYVSLQHRDQLVAAIFADDITVVALNALGSDKSGGQEAATSLRKKVIDPTYDIPVALQRVLNSALTELGYS